MRFPARSAEPELLDTFLVSAVATVLGIRIFLESTGYPQLGGGGLHIAHVLWGGLGMLLAMMLLLLFLSPTTRHIAAIAGGAGFGAFVDELGKFLTTDNDYFFKPTPALLYALFVVLFLAVRQVRQFRGLTPRESLVNAVELAEGLALGGLTESERAKALQLLAAADQSDPLVVPLRTQFAAFDVAMHAPTLLERAAMRAGDIYARVARRRWFRRTIAAVFVLQGIGFVLTIVAALAAVVGALLGIEEARQAVAEARADSTVTSWIQVMAGGVAGVLIVRGVLMLRGSLDRAYRLFELAIFVDLLLVQPFAFLDTGFMAAVDVIIDLALLATLRYLQAQERRLAAFGS